MFISAIVDITKRGRFLQLFRWAGLIVMLLATLIIGSWVAGRIKASVINETAATTALYLDSFVVPNLQELGYDNALTSAHIAKLNELLNETKLGQQIVNIKVWDKDGRILYSSNPALIGRFFLDAQDRNDAWNGKVVANISTLADPENVEERRLYDRLFEIYIPVRLSGTHQVIAIAEFYQEVDNLEMEIASAQKESWLVVVAIMTVIYLLLIVFVQWADNRIGRQEVELKNQVAQLTELLAQNDDLTKRVRRAAANTVALNERLLRRISSELHDGPVQEVSLAMLRLDRVNANNETCRLVTADFECNDHLPTVQTSLQTALWEMRNIATALGLPKLGDLALPEILARVMRAHEQRTGTKVQLALTSPPVQMMLPIKIAIYRFVQEALNYAYAHTGSANQQVRVLSTVDHIHIEVFGQGSGFDFTRPAEWEEYNGPIGMRERIESLGGVFTIENKVDELVKISASLPLMQAGEVVNG